MNVFQFCPICGKQTLKQTLSNLSTCTNCSFEWYQNPTPAANCVIINSKKEILLARRAFDPKKGMWGTVGGFVDLEESLETAVCREIEEEVGLQVLPQRLKYETSGADRYKYSKLNYYTLGTIFSLQISPEEEALLKPNDDVDELKFFTIENIPWQDFAFESGKISLKKAIQNLHLDDYKKDLDQLRVEIDKLDEDLINLLSRRKDLASFVGIYKRKNSLEIYDSKRWQKVLQKIESKANLSSLDVEIITKIWELIHLQSLQVENKISKN
jgi:ADP-ribose pyrophosphatase YjhB (NUDIX family)/chorismate mutase